jgi:hypothetical protein
MWVKWNLVCAKVISMHPQWYFDVTMVKCNLVSVRMEIVLISTHDGSTVCAECSTGMEMALGTPDGTPR